MLRETGIRVHAIAAARGTWGLEPAEIAREYELSHEQVAEALAFYEAHWGEIEASLADEVQAEVSAEICCRVRAAPGSSEEALHLLDKVERGSE